MFYRRFKVSGFVLVAIFLIACQPIVQPLPSEPQPPQGLRPDAPPYAIRGPFAVGTRDYVVAKEDHTLLLTAWYPARNPENAREEIRYQLTEGISSVPPVPPARHIIKGRALRDAAPDVAQGPYPLVVHAPGLGGVRQQNPYLVEHLASHGFVVISWEPRGEVLFGDFWQGAATRPLDMQATIDYAEQLTAVAGEWAGLIDMEQIAVSGFSSGGWTALVGGGAQVDYGMCFANPELAAASELSDCAQFVPHQQEIAAMLGLATAPNGLWPAQNDPRVDAILALTVDGDIWGANFEGLAHLDLPTMIMTGSHDTTITPEANTYPVYEQLGSASQAQKNLVVFEGGDHAIFFNSCRDLPWASEIPYFVCADAVWDMDRVHDLINHLATAFLLAELKGDPDAARALAPEQVSFPGVRYETTAYAATP
ncbi:MAG: prolyl oligopeptidase family serine peptidase [Caldilineaceae bacterium]|nr:prolyl oligopeptidase family serine peptidase [Caldilineaceae bacterium]